MAQSFKENAHLRTDQEKFNEGWDRVFGKKKRYACDDCGEQDNMNHIQCENCFGRNLKEREND